MPLYDLSATGLLKISGSDAKKLLQGQLTCNVDEVSPTQGAMGAHCNPQGRVISLFYLLMLDNIYYLILPRSMLDLAASALKKYAVFYKVVIQQANHEQLLGVQDLTLPANINNIATMNFTDGRSILLGLPETLHLLQQTFADERVLTSEDWHARNIEEMIPTIYPETSATFLPHEINLPALKAVHFEKGCYTGQEIIARMHYRGKLKTHLFKAMLSQDTPPLPGNPIYCKQANQLRTVGTVVDSCQKEYNKHQVLLIADDTNAHNNHLFLHENNQFFMF